MDTSNPNYESTYDLLRGVRGLIRAVMNRVIGALNLQVNP